GEYPRRYGLVERMIPQIDAGLITKLAQAIFRRRQFLQLLRKLLRFYFRAANDRTDADNYLEAIRIASIARHTLVEIGVEILAVLKSALRREHQLGMLGCKLLAALRRAGLDQDRTPLWRGRYVERTPYPK